MLSLTAINLTNVDPTCFSCCAGEVVDRPKLSTAKLGRVEHILSLDESLRSTAVLNTAQNRLLYGLSVILQPPVEPVAPPAFLLGGKSSVSCLRILLCERREMFCSNAFLMGWQPFLRT